MTVLGLRVRMDNHAHKKMEKNGNNPSIQVPGSLYNHSHSIGYPKQTSKGYW